MQIKPFALERYFARYEFSAEVLLSSSDCEPLSLPELLELADASSLALWQGLSLGYTESQGHPLLRQEISRLYSHVRPEDLLVVTPEEGIFISMNVLLKPGDHLIATYPGYQSLYEIALSLGCSLTRWAPDEASGWKFSVDALEEALRPETKLIVVNFPHNPTGALLNHKDFARLLELASARGIRLFSDEMYRFLEADPAERLDSASDLSESAVSLSGLSKTFGLAGLRLGWLATRDAELMARLVALKDYTTICSSAPSEILGIMALRTKERLIERSRGIIRANLAAAGNFFAQHPQVFSWIPPRAGSVAFLPLLWPGGAERFCADLVEAHGAMLLPSTVYGWGDAHVRLGLGRANLPIGLERLEAYLRHLSRV